MTAFRPALGGLLLVVAIAGCSSAGTPSQSPATDRSATPPTVVPGDPGTGGGQGGASGGGSGGGIVGPPLPGGLPAGADLVVPQPGQLDPRPVFISGLAVSVDGRLVTARLTWTSGVEPCYVLDSVTIARDGNTITLSAFEGHGPGNEICIEIAKQKATDVDLGELQPGTYVIDVEPGDATPVTLEIQ